MWNYAMLDVGATLCTARSHSKECPFMKLHGNVGDFVYKKPQKKFANSRRYYRGQILKLLSPRGSLRTDELPKLLGQTSEEVSGILSDLTKERLILRRGGQILLPH
jgi:adenine-specific DNA glycosylase